MLDSVQNCIKVLAIISAFSMLGALYTEDHMQYVSVLESAVPPLQFLLNLEQCKMYKCLCYCSGQMWSSCGHEH